MNAELVTSTIDCAIPDWLQNCLISQPPIKEQGSSAEALSGKNPNSIKESSALPPDKELICKAFSFAYQLHQGQLRASGEPYICHPVAVAGLLRDLGGSPDMIAAGFLHDIVEDTDVTPEELEKLFGIEVRQLVEGVTKLSKFNFSSKTERQAENFRRMFLAMAKDIRVIVVKLADRLHNMRTLEHLADEKRRRIALETREIFAPLANRLGIGRFKWELEDLAFKYLEPEAYRRVQELVAEKRTDREARLAQVGETLRQGLEQVGVECIDISWRPKHLYGVFQKMERQQKEFHQIYDLAAIRIIVQTNEECYRALAVVHDAFRPIPGRFKDYIGLPKPNRYQSLHTVVIGCTGRPVEVQIRTVEMHRVAEYGIAAHWKYKETGRSEHSQVTGADEKFTWLRQLLEWQNDLKDAQEYIESVKDNLFEDDVYVFTPKGDVISLSQRATPVDFAYRIHTEVGHRCSGARVNGRMMPLGTRLKNGDIVEIITQKNGRPRLDWLNFVVTPSARNRIRQWFKRSNREENVARGRELLEKELGKTGFEALLKSEPMQAVAERCNYHSAEDLLAAVGYGEVTLNLVLNRLRDAVRASQPMPVALDNSAELRLSSELAKTTVASTAVKEREGLRSNAPSTQRSPIAGVEGLLYSLAGCCTPIPGEAIIGLVTRSNRGISIHRQGCPNLEGVEGDRLIPVSWNPSESDSLRPQTYPINLQIEVLDRVGVLKDILSRLTDNFINIRSAQVKTFDNRPALISLGIDIRDYDQLERIFTQIKKMSDVLNIRRLSQVED